MKKKIAEVIFEFIRDAGVSTVFGISGGASLHLIHAARSVGLMTIHGHHEQASVMAADGFARSSNQFGCAIATSGPGITNMVTGVAGAFYDSVPLMVIAGQVSTTRQRRNTGCRQIGFQETPIASVFAEITKGVFEIGKNSDPIKVMQDAFDLMSEGRPGPVVIEIADDVQRQIYDVGSKSIGRPANGNSPLPLSISESAITEAINLISRAKRPVAIVGSGIRSEISRDLTYDFIHEFKIPVAPTWGAVDLFKSDSEQLVSTFGTHGQRAGNFAVQNADLIIALGTRLDTKATGSPVSSFARNAKVIMVDVDKAEIEKFKYFGRPIDLSVCSTVEGFLRAIRTRSFPIPSFEEWTKQIKIWKNQLCSVDKEMRIKANSGEVYDFFEKISSCIGSDEVILTDTGCSLPWLMQAFHFKGQQRFFHDFNNTAMGWCLPAALGVNFGSPGRKITCFIGDGSFMMSIQELSVVKNYVPDIDIYILNNFGYSMIKQTQDQWFDGHYFASDDDLNFPDFRSIASASEIHFDSFDVKDLDAHIKSKPRKGVNLFEVKIPEDARVIPQVKFGRPNEDMEPLLPNALFDDCMLIRSMR